jgi:hypothetical protein
MIVSDIYRQSNNQPSYNINQTQQSTAVIVATMPKIMAVMGGT